MTVYLKQGSRFIGVAPGTTKVYADRDKGAGWEAIELTDIGDGNFLARFVEADVMLCITPGGHLETRPAGSAGPWETMRCATQPDKTTHILYRVDGDNVVASLQIVEA